MPTKHSSLLYASQPLSIWLAKHWVLEIPKQRMMQSGWWALPMFDSEMPSSSTELLRSVLSRSSSLPHTRKTLLYNAPSLEQDYDKKLFFFSGWTASFARVPAKGRLVFSQKSCSLHRWKRNCRVRASIWWATHNVRWIRAQPALDTWRTYSARTSSAHPKQRVKRGIV